MSEFKELIQELGKGQEAAYKANKELLAVVTGASEPGKAGHAREVARALAAELNALTPARKDDKGKDVPQALLYSAAVRCRIAQLLCYVAGAEEVPALDAAMNDMDVREAARMALEVNPSPEATKALLKAMEAVGPVFRVGIVNALGRRKPAEAVTQLQELAMNDPEAEVRIAAVEALSKIPEAGSDSSFVQVAKSECPCTRSRANKARVRLAETLRLAGQKEAAARIYRAIERSDADAAQKKAAELGLKALV